MFLIGDNGQQRCYLHHAKNLWQLVCFTGIKSRRHNKRWRIHEFVIEAAGLSYLVAFLPANAMGFDDEGDVVDDVGLADTLRQHIIIMGK